LEGPSFPCKYVHLVSDKMPIGRPKRRYKMEDIVNSKV